MTKEQNRPNTHRIIHPPVVALFYIVIAYLLGWLIRIPFAVPIFLRNIGFALVVIGFLLGLAALVEFRRVRTTLNPHGSTSQLATGGIYRFTRNPIYLGFLLMIIGLPLNSGFYWGIIMAPLYVITLNRLVIEREEAYLEEKFKDVYAGYRSRVRRWL
jgi:protein-S-isoprenylcysteine O-methyltransferase Ste14